MTTARRLLVALLLGLPAALPAAESIDVTEAWVRATPPGAATAAAYLTLVNHGTADRLLGATTPVAHAVELHTHAVTAAGTTTMQAIPEVSLPAGATVELAPGGLHLMLIGLEGPLVPGTNVRLTLHLAGAGELTLDVPVRDGRLEAHRH